MAYCFRRFFRLAALAAVRLSSAFPVEGVAVVYRTARGLHTAVYEGNGGIQTGHGASIPDALSALRPYSESEARKKTDAGRT